MPEAQPTPQPAPQQVSLIDHINGQKGAIGTKGNELINIMNNIIDTWANNFVIAEKLKGKRTEQVNFFLGFLNQLANEGFAPLNQLGTDVKDPEVSNQILECNNNLMTLARNILANTQQQEETFQKELQDMMKGAQQAPAGVATAKTEVKAQEA
jgi:hypothetical protein